jgi:dethiobiotin synthetase
MKGLQKRFDKVGFIKPVGQQHIAVSDAAGNEIRVDKDVQVMKEFFSLDHIEYADMSPVIIPKGYTSRYIDSEINSDAQVEAIRRSFAAQSAVSDAVLVEGTGHVGVGSIVELSNAKAAALVGADVVLVTNGGLGKAFDELEMNRQMFANEGVKVRGVVLNKVMPHKVAQVRQKMGKVMMERWGIPLLGVVPDLPYLGSSSLRDIEQALDGNLLAGEKCRGLHYGLNDIFLVTTGLRRFLRRAFQQREKLWRRPLFVTHSVRR